MDLVKKIDDKRTFEETTGIPAKEISLVKIV